MVNESSRADAQPGSTPSSSKTNAVSAGDFRVTGTSLSAMLDQAQVVFTAFEATLKKFLESTSARDLSTEQALIIYRMPDAPIPTGEIRVRHIYTGSSEFYNIKKLKADGYLIQPPSTGDRRHSLIQLTENGRELRTAMQQFFDAQEKTVGWGVASEDFEAIGRTLRRGINFMTWIRDRKPSGV